MQNREVTCYVVSFAHYPFMKCTTLVVIQVDNLVVFKLTRGCINRKMTFLPRLLFQDFQVMQTPYAWWYQNADKGYGLYSGFGSTNLQYSRLSVEGFQPSVYE